MFKVNVNKASTFEIEHTPDGMMVDGKPFHWDLQRLSEGHFHILHDKKSYRAEVVKVDKATKTFILKINNHLHTVELKDKFDVLLEKLGMQNGASHKVNNVMGQGLLCKRLGKTRIIAETGAGQHGFATATMAARMGFSCKIYMGAVDVARQRPNVFWMENLGATV